MRALWEWLTDDKNHRALQLILTLITGLAVGGWTLFTAYFKAPPAPPQAALPGSAPAPAAEKPVLLADTRAKLVTQAESIFYFEDESGAFSVDQSLLLKENHITTAAQASQFKEVVESDLRHCSEAAASRAGLAEKLAARTTCLEQKGYSDNTQRYLRAKHGLAS